MEKTLNFEPYYIPPLEDGSYKVIVRQEVKIDTANIRDAVLEFEVDGPQIVLDKNDVYSLYPPKNTVGKFGKCLPHVIIHRKSLPWERKLTGLSEQTPWVALFVFSEREGVEATNNCTYGEAKKPKNGVFVPKIDESSRKDSDSCNIIEIPRDLFLKVLPSAKDLTYMSHTRCADLDLKAYDKAVSDNWFSCCVANRYPEEAEQSGVNITNTAYLVSLEGFENYILRNQASGDPIYSCDKVRMYNLYSWKFQVQHIDYDFYTLAKALDVDSLQLQIPANVQGDDTDFVTKLFHLGYSPVNHYFREGSEAVSWYRSPFVPRRPYYNEKITYYGYSDQLLHYDENIAMFDITYSAAWQLGKLLALQNKDFTRLLLSWRVSQKQNAVSSQMNRFIQKAIVHNHVKSMEEDTSTLCKEAWRESMEELLESSTVQSDRMELQSKYRHFSSKAKAEKLKHISKLTQADILEDELVES